MLAASPSFGIQFVEEKSKAIQDFCFMLGNLYFPSECFWALLLFIFIIK